MINFGTIAWTDNDRVRKLVTEEIPAKVSADKAYQNAKKNSDKQNARIEHDKALKRVMTPFSRTIPSFTNSSATIPTSDAG